MSDSSTTATAKKPAPPAAPPATGAARLPLAYNGSIEVSGPAIAAMYQRCQQGNGGFFPLGDSELFHCGAHLPAAAGDAVHSIADGEIVAARLSQGPGAHPWGDTGFVLLRHPVTVGGAAKTLYVLYVQLKKEPLNPDATEAKWLQRLLAAAMDEAQQKPKWRVIQPVPTWTEDAKGKFSPTNIQNDKLLDKGVYTQDDELILDHKHYVKLSGKWVRGAGGNGDASRIKEMSPYADFDLDTAKKNSKLVANLADGKTAVFDSEKDAAGKHKWKVESGEAVGAVGMYLGGAAIHMSVFSADSVFPEGALPDAEFGPDDPVTLASLDISSKAPGTPEHATALITALDPKNQFLGKIADTSVIDPTELRAFYRADSDCWRSRYQAVKGIVDFNTDVDKLIAQDRYKSHTDEQKSDFKTGAKDFLFWKDLSSADDVPSDGTAIFVHPITAVRLMTTVAVDVPRKGSADAGGDDRLHANEDVTISVRGKSGPISKLMVTVTGDEGVIVSQATDAAGEILVPIEKVKGQDIKVSVPKAAVGKGGKFINVVNETGGPVKLQPGLPPSVQPFNANETVPKPTMRLPMQVAPGKSPTLYSAWDEEVLQLQGPLDTGLVTNETLIVDRFVFRRDDGKYEAVEATNSSGQRVYLWAIDNGTANLVAQPDPSVIKAAGKDPAVIASWSEEMAHVNDHPVLTGRVLNVDDGAELDIAFYGMRALQSPEHDELLTSKKVKTIAGGFSCDFDPAPLAQGSDLLISARPVFAVVTVKGKKLSLRGQAIMLYAVGAQLPKTPPEAPEQETGGSGVMAFFQIARDGGLDKPTTWDGKPASTKTLAAIDDAHLKARIVGEGGWDQFVVGPVTTSQHIALESQMSLKPAEALQQQEAATRAAFPNAPAWLFAHGHHLAAADNGISMGLCASDCKDKLSAWGVASGCSEEIRVRNLSACKNAHHAACQSVRPPAKASLKVIGTCAEEPGKCGEARHDKSRCFLKQPIPGANAEERERWHIALPLRAKDKKGNYPYQGALKVLVFNPVTGEGVVCSQEDRGPSSTAFGSAAVDTLGIKADEFKGKPHVASISYEAAWKLGLNRNGQGDSVVMLAFVRASTPLGPLKPDTKITLRKQATQGQLLGIEAVPDQLAPPPAPGAEEKEESQSSGGKTKHVVPGPAPTPPSPKPPVPETRKLVPLRQKIVDAAKAELGKVDDRGPGGKRKGAEQLQKYLEHALGTTAAKEGWAEALKIPGQRPGGLRWSGHFTAYLAKHVGLKAGWDAVNSVLQGVGAARYDQDYAPGDILVLKGQLQHHCVLIERKGDQLVTISGDGPYQTIELRNRKPSEVTSYYRLSADTFAAK